jgi:hypothetical protein
VYRLVKLFEVYRELGVPEAKLLPIGTTKLSVVIPVVKTDVDLWLTKAAELSKSDLINEVRVAQGKQEMPFSPPPSFESPPEGGPSCLLHPDRVGERAHFPITEKMGGKLTVPLCRECHNEYHNIGVWTWAERYARKWAEYLYNLINEKSISQS